MKKLFILVAASALFACNTHDHKATGDGAQTTTSEHTAKTDPSKLTTIEWIDGIDRDMGKINEGPDLEVTFRFKNTGNNPLVVSQVSASCGCTTPETPKEPIAPGAEGRIKALFKSAGRPGFQKKQVFVHANTDPNPTTLSFSVEVVKAAQQQ